MFDGMLNSLPIRSLWNKPFGYCMMSVTSNSSSVLIVKLRNQKFSFKHFFFREWRELSGDKR